MYIEILKIWNVFVYLNVFQKQNANAYLATFYYCSIYMEEAKWGLYKRLWNVAENVVRNAVPISSDSPANGLLFQ